VEVLRRAGCALLVSTYQAGKLIAIGVDDTGLHFSFHTLGQAMGIAMTDGRMAVGGKGQIVDFADHSALAPSLEPAGRYDRCFLPRSTTLTGAIHCHELAWGADADGKPELWVVNTLFSCLANIDPQYSFVPRWRPPFISALAAEDRCHMNGLAMRDGSPAYVTAMSQTDEARGWRQEKNTTGCVLEVPTGRIVTTGLAMPHSPRVFRDRLLVLNSGWGTLESVDIESGQRAQIASVPGFSRGLAIHRNLAFVGLSRIRETAVFGGLPIAAHAEELKCGVGVIELESGRTVATLEFESGVEEIFDVQVLPNARSVALGDDRAEDGERHEIWVVPPEHTTKPIEPAIPPEALVAQALEHQANGRAADAVELLSRAAAARPASAEIVNHLGNALQDAGRQDEALVQYRAALTADPRFTPALQNLGHLLINRGRTDEGLAALKRAQEIDPRAVNRVMSATALPVIYASFEDAQRHRARIETEVAALVADGVTLYTADTLAPTNFFTAYLGENDRQLQSNLGQVFRGPELGVRATGRTTRTRLRIGFISAYFRDHTIGRLNLGRIRELSRERFEVVVFTSTHAQDPIARQFEDAADTFVRLPRGVAAARAAVVEQDLDLLLFTDVGMDALTYTLAFSRMAPVQVATWGHPVTTGSPHIDWFLSSELLEVGDADAHYTERLARLPSLGTYYERPQVTADESLRTRLGVGADAHLYVCPQTLFKFHPSYDPLLAEILRRDPQGLLLLVQGRVPYWTDQLRERFQRVMPDVADRIRWCPPLPREAFLQLLACADVALDPTVFGGGNTSYETLAVGTPLVTLPGELMRSRISRALYAKAGLEDLVAESSEDYVDRAVQIATDPAHRSEVSARIAAACEVLYEDPTEVRDLEDFLATAVAI
jgi:uncharacterized protein (TIGR03032 family)